MQRTPGWDLEESWNTRAEHCLTDRETRQKTAQKFVYGHLPTYQKVRPIDSDFLIPFPWSAAWLNSATQISLRLKMFWEFFLPRLHPETKSVFVTTFTLNLAGRQAEPRKVNMKLLPACWVRIHQCLFWRWYQAVGPGRKSAREYSLCISKGHLLIMWPGELFFFFFWAGESLII